MPIESQTGAIGLSITNTTQHNRRPSAEGTWAATCKVYFWFL